jgi:hypothetical protein
LEERGVNKVQRNDVDDQSFRVELDSNADTCYVGGGVMIVNDTDRFINVTPFVKSLATTKRVPIVSAAIVYDDPRSGKVYVLIIHQALYFPDMPRSLLCPVQLRLNDVVINERPKFLTKHPTDKDHAMIIEDELVIPFEIHKVASYFHARKPTKKEYEECARFELTNPFPEWSPHDPVYAEEESKRLDDEGYVRQFRNHRQVSSVIHDEGDFINGVNGWTTPIMKYRTFHL